ncbi:NADPH-dependent F420 reductase [Andreprevotia chitinilytica]|uniref:NADPH-dependent F420 reductase n=1 Tax=Andreprevotia chitinilytica TaxID=396808 RepID=UPI000557891B|nr:NAD(P)-binding domain-containing protein [Andreprevotia chitinilytica]
MNITLIGYGNMGSGIAQRALAAGHQVTLAGADVAKAQEVAAKLGTGAATVATAVASADLVVLATPFGAAEDIVRSAGGFAGKVVIDISNPVKADFSGLAIGHSTSAAEEIQTLAPQARVVKAFNTVFAQVFAEGAEIAGRKVQVFVAADDAVAKATASEFAASLGFEAVDTGPLENARLLEPLGMLNITFGYKLGRGTGIAPVWLQR